MVINSRRESCVEHSVFQSQVSVKSLEDKENQIEVYCYSWKVKERVFVCYSTVRSSFRTTQM